MDFIFNDYASFKIDNSEVMEMVASNSDIASRFKHVYDIVEYIYNLRLEDEVEADLVDIFSYAFDYLFDQIEIINNLVEEYYTDLREMNIHAKTVNLLMNILDYSKEVDEQSKKHMDEYKNLEEKVYEYLKAKEEAPMDLFEQLDKINANAFDDDFKGALEIFSDIAYELDLMDDVEDVYVIE